MRVTCPACAAIYDVPDARIGAGRRLRCARCQHDWFVTLPAPAERPAGESAFARAVEQAGARPATPDEPRPAASPAAFDPPPPPSAAAAGSAGNGLPAAADRPDIPAAQPTRAAGGDDGAQPAPAGGRSGALAAAAPEPRAAPPVQAPTGPRPAPRPVAVTQVDRSGSLMVAWVVTLMLFCGFAAAVVLYRIEIMEAWPPAERLYAALGMLRR